MVIYLDSSAAVKLARYEAHSDELITWVNEQPDLTMVSSVLVEVEAHRALHRHDPAALANLPTMLARLLRVEIHATVRAIAGAYQHASLRSLDAIHLATAAYVASTERLDALVAYDSRLLDLARAEGFTTLSPGL